MFLPVCVFGISFHLWYGIGQRQRRGRSSGHWATGERDAAKYFRPSLAPRLPEGREGIPSGGSWSLSKCATDEVFEEMHDMNAIDRRKSGNLQRRILKKKR